MDNNIQSIANIKNFKETFNLNTVPDAISKYYALISEFFLCAIENITIKNDKYYVFVLQRGLETLKHCFKMIYMYTKNLDLTMSYCKRAYCYYIEFIGQIGEDNHRYLQLTSKDAAFFVYKKTIFEIDNNYRKKFVLSDKDALYLDVLTNVIDIYHELIMCIISKKENFIESKDKVIQYTLKMTRKIINNVYIDHIMLKKTMEKLNIILFFIYSIKGYFDDLNMYCIVCGLFIKKVQNKDVTIEHLYEKIFRRDIKKILDNYTPTRIINWLFQ